jgi:uncharacterized phage protein gp47/JayE
MDADTVDMQVSIRGGGFSSDPDYITFEGTRFIIPNPSAFPDGLLLLSGDNTIEVKGILSNGEVTPSGDVKAILSTDADIRGIAFAPSGIFIERFDGTVSITVDGIDHPSVQGYHYYASTQPGGGTTGYSRINPTLVVSGESLETFSTLGLLEVDAAVATNIDGTRAADPIFVVVQGTQQDQARDVIQTDFNEALEIPEDVDQVRTSVVVQGVTVAQRYSFVHDRLSTYDSSVNPAIPNSDFNTILPSEPLYYVVTAVWLIDGEEFESDFSPEVTGSPLVITPTVGTFPTVTRQQIVRDTTLSIFRSQPEIDVKPGAAIRDVVIDPFSTEAERIRFITDFVHNAQSFTTLLLIDDPGNTGDSIDVNQSQYKLALRAAFFLDDNTSVQALIDNAFDKLASNYGETRLGGKRARGEITISLPSQPATSITWPIGQQIGGGGTTFRMTSSATITSTGSGAFFNPSTGRYIARGFIQAETPGSLGNLAPGQVNTILNGPPAGSKATVTNQARTFGGFDEETNRDLATRVMRKLAGADSGRYQGYVNTAAKVPGVLQVNVVDPGHPLMQRDRNENGVHVGGKVDVWIRGESISTVTDRFAFSFELRENVQFEVVGDPTDLRFRAVDPNLSDDNPIIEMLDYPSAGYIFRNGTTGYIYDLTNVEILRPDGIQLDTTLNTPEGSLTDVFFGSYRYRSSNKHVFTRQPVQTILTFEGDPDRSGIISPAFYSLFHPESPLEEGLSSEAGDYVQVIQPDDTDPLDVPSSDPVVVTDEDHVMLDGVEYLDNLGVNPVSVQVWDAEKVIEYASPFVSATPDYTIIDEDPPNTLGIRLTSSSAIEEGQQVLVDYQHDENFTVEFTTNSLVAITQEEVDDFRHLTADVLVKEAVSVPVDLSGTIVLRNGADTNSADSDVRTAIARLFGTLVLGEPLRQSDVLNVLDSVGSVSYVVSPLTKMVRADGARVVREPLFTDQDADWTLLTAWSTPTVLTYLLDNPLVSATSDGGGPANEFRGVFADEDPLLNLDTAPNINGVPLKNSAGSAFIVGNAGIIIPGFSDDATLAVEFPFATAAELDDHRKEITADRVIVTLLLTQTPSDFEYAVTYLVDGDEGVKNIEPGPTEYLVVGDTDFVFDEDVDFTARVTGRVR